MFEAIGLRGGDDPARRGVALRAEPVEGVVVGPNALLADVGAAFQYFFFRHGFSRYVWECENKVIVKQSRTP